MPVTKKPAKATSSLKLEELSQEDRKKYDSLVEDFDRQLEKHLADIRAGADAIKNQLESMARVAILNLPRNMRKKTLGEIVAFSVGEDDGMGSTEPQQQQKTDFDEVAEKVNAEVKRGIRSTKKKVAKRATKTSIAPPSTGLRRSTRRKIPKGHLDMIGITPISSRPPSATPLITPKFDPSMPLERTVMRVAKPDETLVSLSGSPVYAGPLAQSTAIKASSRRGAPPTTGRARTASKAKKAEEWDSTMLLPIPLGNGRTMMLPIDDGGANGSSNDTCAPLDLDDNERKKLEAIRMKLGTMLNMN